MPHAQASGGRTRVFAAIDFETADHRRDSACALAVVRVVDNQIVKRVHHLIRPPRKEFVFTDIHGICWADVAHAPSFADLWPSIKAELEGVDFLAAHNAPFDQSVLAACCHGARLKPPPHPFKCTVELARSVWGIYPTTLPDVCRRLRISLRHHDPASDAEACAQIVIMAARAGAAVLPGPGAGSTRARGNVRW